MIQDSRICRRARQKHHRESSLLGWSLPSEGLRLYYIWVQMNLLPIAHLALVNHCLGEEKRGGDRRREKRSTYVHLASQPPQRNGITSIGLPLHRSRLNRRRGTPFLRQPRLGVNHQRNRIADGTAGEGEKGRALGGNLAREPRKGQRVRARLVRERLLCIERRVIM